MTSKKLTIIGSLMAAFCFNGCYTSFIAVQPAASSEYVEEYIEYNEDQSAPRIVEYRYIRPARKTIYFNTTIGFHYLPHHWWLYDYQGPVSIGFVYGPAWYDDFDYWDYYYWDNYYEWVYWDYHHPWWWNRPCQFVYHPVHWFHPVHFYNPRHHDYFVFGGYHFAHHKNRIPPGSKRTFTKRTEITGQNQPGRRNNSDSNQRRTLAVRSTQNPGKESQPVKRRSQTITSRNQSSPDNNTSNNRRSTSSRTQIVVKEKQSENQSRTGVDRRNQNNGSSNVNTGSNEVSWGNRTQTRRPYQENQPDESSRNQNTAVKTSRIILSRQPTRRNSDNNSRAAVQKNKTRETSPTTAKLKTQPSRSESTRNVRNDSNRSSSGSTVVTSSRKVSTSSSRKVTSRSSQSPSDKQSRKSESKSGQKSSSKSGSSGRRR